MLHSKMGLEMRMRDALDGMEQLASMYAYGRLPAEMEILTAEPEPAPQQHVLPPPTEAQILQFPRMTALTPGQVQPEIEKNNKIIML